MSNPIGITPELMTDASLFAGLAVLLAALGHLVPRERRRGLLSLALLAIAALGAIAALDRFGARLGSGMPYDIAREALLGVLAIAVIRASVLFLARVVFGRLRVPHILIDVLFVLGMIAYSIYRLNAIGVNLAGIVTTSAIVTGALAFSAGETLGNLWAGLSLQLENTLRIGDWVRIGDRVGQVVSIRWRSMAIATADHETIVLPNSALMKDRVVVLGRVGEAHSPYRRFAKFSVDYDYHPHNVIRAVNEALAVSDIPDVAERPVPVCLCREFQATGVEYQVAFYPKDVGRMVEAESEVLLHVYVALERAQMAISPSKHQIEHKQDAQPVLDAAEARIRKASVEQPELLSMLTGEERAALAEDLVRLPYAQGDTLFRQGESGDSLYILASGRVRIMDESESGVRTHLAELAAPSYFGEMGLLTGQPRRATVAAAEPLLCYRIGKPAFDTILRGRPEIVEALGEALVKRQAENDATLKAFGAHAGHGAGGAREFVRRIRQFFALPGARG